MLSDIAAKKLLKQEKKGDQDNCPVGRHKVHYQFG